MVAVLRTIASISPGCDAGLRHRVERRLGGHGARRLVVARDAPLNDTGALEDPVVIGLEAERGEVVVRHHLGGNAPPGAGDVRDGPLHAAVSVAAARRCPMRSFMPLVDRLRRRLERVLDGARRRLAVRDDAHALHAEERRAAVLGVVEVLEPCLELRGIDAGVAERLDHERRDALVELEQHVADEAVADDDVEVVMVGAAGGKVASLDVADEVEPRLAAAARCASFVTAFPFSGSSPMLSSPTAGFGRPMTHSA